MKIEVCKPKDNDACLQSSPGWSASWTCENTGTEYCESWAKDMKRCCPESCNTENLVTIKFSEEDCNKSSGKGTCTYPNKAQCTDGKLLNINVLLILKRIICGNFPLDCSLELSFLFYFSLKT